MDSLISTFHIDWKLMVAQLVNFAIVMIVLWVFALKPLKKLMDERGKTIAGGLENAKKQEALLAKQKEDYEAMMAKANAEGIIKIKQAAKDAQMKADAILAKAQEDAEGIAAAGRKQLESDKLKMLDEAKAELVSLVVSATEKVLGTAASGKVETKLVEESIKQL